MNPSLTRLVLGDSRLLGLALFGSVFTGVGWALVAVQLFWVGEAGVCSGVECFQHCSISGAGWWKAELLWSCLRFSWLLSPIWKAFVLDYTPCILERWFKYPAQAKAKLAWGNDPEHILTERLWRMPSWFESDQFESVWREITSQHRVI